MLRAGTKLGRYEVRSPLGAGGMGEVYLARDAQLDRQAALKVLPAAVAADPDRMRRFVQEARAASALNHPNIITIYEIDQSGPTSFIAMEFIDGATLRQRMGGHPMPLGDVLAIAVQAAAALAAAHASGIVHRDIKPENIVVRSDGIVKVLDFGLATMSGARPPGDGDLATRTHAETMSGVVLGTATYMSPEQARGQRVDARTDIFSLGVVLYELLTGRLPFEGASIYEIVAALLGDDDPPPLSRLARGLPEEIERIVGKALQKSPEQRYQTVKDLLLDLQNLQRGLELRKTSSVSAPPPVRRWTVAIAVGVVLVIGAAIGLAWWRLAHVQRAIRSLAVLPLKSLDAGDNYLSLGIADAAIRRVSQTGSLIVRPTSAVRRYLTEDTDALTAAKQLGVDSVLEGVFQHAGDRLRVSFNLLRCADGVSLWSDSFDITKADIFTVQDVVAQKVAASLRLQLDASQQAQLTRRPTSNASAYELYLKGLYAFDQRTSHPAQMMSSAIAFYEQAIAADANFALAHAQLAYAYATIAVFLEPTEPKWIRLAREEIAAADALDPQLADTHLARFQILYSQYEGYQGEAAAREALLANQLNPNVGHWELSYIYTHFGLEDLAARELARGLQVDPTSDALYGTKLLMYEVQSRYDDYAADPGVRRQGRNEVWYWIGKGRLDRAQTAMDAWAAGEYERASLAPTHALLLAAQGEFQRAEAEIPEILRLHRVKDPLYHHAAYDIACIYALEGKSAEAVHWLRDSAVTGFHLYPRYTRDHLLDRIRTSSQFIAFLADMKAENDSFRRELPGI